MQLNKKLMISIYSVSGGLIKTIQSSSGNQSVKLNISALGRGTYIIKVLGEDTVLSKRFVKL
jgi:hypothetical protein